MVKDKVFIGIIIGGFIIFFCTGWLIGWYANNTFEKESYDKIWDGQLYRNVTKEVNEAHLNKIEPLGDWVSINIKNLTPKRALEVCRHEVGHEMFAEFCEQSPESFERCMGVVN